MKKDHGAWTIPKGEDEPQEEPLAAAQREFEEETGFAAAENFIELSATHRKAEKTVNAWAVQEI